MDCSINSFFHNNPTLYRIRSDMDNATYLIRRNAAEKLLNYYRQVLTHFNMAHHVVVIYAYEGHPQLLIDGEPLHEKYAKAMGHEFPVLRALREIEGSLDKDLLTFYKGQHLT